MSLQQAAKELEHANHLLHVYGFLNESKLLLNISEHCFKAMEATLQAFIEESSPLPLSSFSQQLIHFKLKVQPKYRLDPVFGRLMQDLYILKKKQKEAPMQVAREDSVVLYSDAYEEEKITPERVKMFLEKAKLFIDEYARIFSHG
jgi:hypothetical protein